MGNIKIKRKKAPLGAAIPIISTVLSTAGNIFGGIMQNNAQAKALEEQQKIADYQNKFNILSSTQGTLNNHFATQQNVEYPQMILKNGGNIKSHNGVKVERGGTLYPLGGNLAYVKGRPHSKGGVDLNVEGVPAELEGGETIARNGDEYNVFSNRLHIPMLGGKTPSQYVRQNPQNEEVQMVAKVAQEIYKDYMGLNDDGSRRGNKLPPVGRIMAPYGTTLPGAYTPYNLYRRYKNSKLPDFYGVDAPKLNRYNVTDMGDNYFYGRSWLESQGSNYYNPRDTNYSIKVGDNTIYGRPPGYASFRSSDGLDLPDIVATGRYKHLKGKTPYTPTIPDVHDAWQTTPAMKNARDLGGMYNNWLARNGLRLYTADLATAAVQGALPWLANTVYNKSYGAVDKLWGDLSKQIQAGQPIQAAYSGMDTRNPMQWAEYADRIRRGQEERRALASNKNSSIALTDAINKSLTDQGIDTDKIFDKYAEQNFAARLEDAKLRTQTAVENARSANQFNYEKWATLAGLTRDRAANMSAKYSSNADAINASIGAFTNLINVGKEQFDNERERALGLNMIRSGITNKDVLNEFDKAIPPYMYDWRTNPYLQSGRTPWYHYLFR